MANGPPFGPYEWCDWEPEGECLYVGGDLEWTCSLTDQLDVHEASAEAMVHELLCGAIPAGVDVTGQQFNGDPSAAGIFTGGSSAIGIERGVVLSTGEAEGLTSGGSGGFHSEEFDEDGCKCLGCKPPWCDGVYEGCINPNDTQDRACLGFTVQSDTGCLLVCLYVFGSEEYPEWVGSQYNDATAICRMGGVLLHLLGTVNTAPFVANTSNELSLDGLTPVLGRLIQLNANEEYALRFVVADNSDGIYDSALFVKCWFVGKCCMCVGPDCTCEDGVLEEECDGTWTEGQLCIDNDPPCGDTTGSCCLLDGGCMITSPAGCIVGGGIYLGDDTTCGPTGACCLGDGTCIDVSDDCCLEAEGTYQGQGTACAPKGACYAADPLSCVETIANCCAGTYQGDGIPCEAIGACCFADGSCDVMMESSCEASGGTPQGDGTWCIGDTDGDGIDDTCEAHEAPAVCGNGVHEAGEQCDGDDDDLCPGRCRSDCTCGPPDGSYPTLPQWGLIVLGLLLVAGGTIVLRRRRPRIGLNTE